MPLCGVMQAPGQMREGGTAAVDALKTNFGDGHAEDADVRSHSVQKVPPLKKPSIRPEGIVSLISWVTNNPTGTPTSVVLDAYPHVLMINLPSFAFLLSRKYSTLPRSK